MSQIIFEPSKQIYYEDDGKRFLVFDGSDIFANHSAVSMALPDKDYLSGTEPVDFFPPTA